MYALGVILGIIESSERITAKELQKILGLHIATVSKHLNKLREEGFIHIVSYEDTSGFPARVYSVKSAGREVQVPSGYQILKDTLALYPNSPARDLSKLSGISKSHTETLLRRMVREGEVHISGFEPTGRYRRLYKLGRGKAPVKLKAGEKEILKVLEGGRVKEAKEISKILGLPMSTTRRHLSNLVSKKQIHVSGYKEAKRRKPKLYALGEGENVKYPYISESEKRSKLLSYQKSYARRRRIMEATKTGGALAGMVAQILK